MRMHLHVKSFALCAFYFPQPPLFPPSPRSTRLLLTCSGSWFATSLFWGLPLGLLPLPLPLLLLLLLLALSPSLTVSLSLRVLRFCCPFLYYFLSLFLCAVATAEVLCNRHFCVLREGGSKKRLTKDHGEGSTKCEWQTTVRSEHLGNKHKYERAPCRIYNSECHSTTS